MNTWSLALLGFSLLYLSGCGEGPPITEFVVVSDDELVTKSLPAIRRACPGLDKYSSSFEKARIENNYRTSILFDVRESSKIPEAFKAGGHTCYVEIDSTGKSIYIEKLACKSICLDQLNTPEGQLKIDLSPENS